LIHVSRRDFSFVEEENLSQLFHLFKEHRIRVNMMQNSAISFSICVNNVAERVEKLLEELKKEYNVIKDDNLELITIRHYKPETLREMKRNKMVLLEERIPKTIQLVVRDTPLMERI
jgi:aspartate kinase